MIIQLVDREMTCVKITSTINRQVVRFERNATVDDVVQQAVIEIVFTEPTDFEVGETYSLVVEARDVSIGPQTETPAG